MLRQHGKKSRKPHPLDERSFRVCAVPSSFDRLGYALAVGAALCGMELTKIWRRKRVSGEGWVSGANRTLP